MTRYNPILAFVSLNFLFCRILSWVDIILRAFRMWIPSLVSINLVNLNKKRTTDFWEMVPEMSVLNFVVICIMWLIPWIIETSLFWKLIKQNKTTHIILNLFFQKMTRTNQHKKKTHALYQSYRCKIQTKKKKNALQAIAVKYWQKRRKHIHCELAIHVKYW